MVAKNMMSSWKGICVPFLIFTLVIMMTGCGGGGGGFVPSPDPDPDPNPQATVYQAFDADSNGDVIDVAGLYTPPGGKTVTITPGQKIKIPKGGSITVSGKIYGKRVRTTRTGSFGRLEITNVTVNNGPLINNRQGKFVLLLDGRNLANAGSTDFTWTINCDDLPQDGTFVPITLKAEIQDNWLGEYAMDLFGAEPRPDQPPTMGRDDDGDDAWIFPASIVGLGILASFIIPICPTAELTFYAACEMGMPPAPPAIISLDLQGPTEVQSGSTHTVSVVTNCTDWTLTGPSWFGTKTGSGNASYNVTFPTVTADTQVRFDLDGCSKSDSLTITIKAPAVADHIHCALQATVTSGTAPLSTRLFVDVDSNLVVTEYHWDFDGNGAYDDETTQNQIDHTYTTAGTFTAKVKVFTEKPSVTCEDTLTITVNGSGGGGGGKTFDGKPWDPSKLQVVRDNAPLPEKSAPPLDWDQEHRSHHTLKVVYDGQSYTEFSNTWEVAEWMTDHDQTGAPIIVPETLAEMIESQIEAERTPDMLHYGVFETRRIPASMRPAEGGQINVRVFARVKIYTKTNGVDDPTYIEFDLGVQPVINSPTGS